MPSVSSVAAHLRGARSSTARRPRRDRPARASRVRRARASTSAPRSLPTSTRKRCSSVEQLGQREVEARSPPRAGVHRDAEAGAARLAAVDGDDERALAPRRVVGVDVAAADEHAVLDRDRVQVAASARRGTRTAAPAAAPPRPPVPSPFRRARQSRTRGREQELLPRVRPDGVAEERLVVAALEPVACRRPGSSVQPAGRSSAESSSS